MKSKVVLFVGALLVSQLSWAGDHFLKVTEKGFEPGSITVSAGEDVNLKVTRTTDNTCAKQIWVPSIKLKVKLPLNKEVTLALGRPPQGEIKFACGMGMLSGVIVAN